MEREFTPAWRRHHQYQQRQRKQPAARRRQSACSSAGRRLDRRGAPHGLVADDADAISTMPASARGPWSFCRRRSAPGGLKAPFGTGVRGRIRRHARPGLLGARRPWTASSPSGRPVTFAWAVGRSASLGAVSGGDGRHRSMPCDRGDAGDRPAGRSASVSASSSPGASWNASFSAFNRAPAGTECAADQRQQATTRRSRPTRMRQALAAGLGVHGSRGWELDGDQVPLVVRRRGDHATLPARLVRFDRLGSRTGGAPVPSMP